MALQVGLGSPDKERMPDRQLITIALHLGKDAYLHEKPLGGCKTRYELEIRAVQCA